MTLMLPSGAPAAGRVELSSGVLPATETICATTYSDGAMVPNQRWRPPTCHERSVLYGTPAPQARPGDWITVLPVPAQVLSAFTALRAAAADGDGQALRSLIDGPAGRMALVEAIRWAMTLNDPARPGIENPLIYGRTPAGNPTMTTGDDGRRVGLHVDSWDDSPLAERATAPNRLSVNVGHHDRWLLCVNAPLQAMERALRRRGLLDGADNPRRALGNRFMEVFPRYPVTKITIHPGEAYIAPTENMLHDGYAEPNGQIDLQFCCRGYFVVPHGISTHTR
ncbi:hypothetical protein [Nocardia arthritidis]|uniref:Phytanoyl-CoA dioxygenase n=1 Tax=Nocardia arthritidis TaxID=228602 RepID=A0A6G9YE60_9NOCA|nr:hypothetical protein [Nocardia arthritidis]QIS11482.1 hypothetical protein F5544_18040 [Nocardia arthritidis]